MSILLNRDTRAIVQGITGQIGRIQTEWMLEYGTHLVGGVTPGKGGEEVCGLKVYDDVVEVVKREGANASIILVPPPFARDAALEALDAGIRLVIVISEHIPVHDTLLMKEKAESCNAILLGPNTPGIISPGIGKLGIMPGNLFKEGTIGLISRSGTLSYEVAGLLSEVGLGVSTLIGVGGDPIIGTRMAHLLIAFDGDPQTTGIIIIGEIGGNNEEEAAKVIPMLHRPVLAYIAGKTAPRGRRMGHAGAIIRKEGGGTVESKVHAFREAGAPVISQLTQITSMFKELF